MKFNRKAIDLLRGEKCWTIEDLADKAGISPSSIRNGTKRDINPVVAGKLAAALGVPMRDIVILED